MMSDVNQFDHLIAIIVNDHKKTKHKPWKIAALRTLV